MELPFEKKTERFWMQKLYAPVMREESQELRLPESMPDVGRVIAAWGQPVLRGKEWRSDHIALTGGVMVWVLYAPEDGSGCRRLESWVPFHIRMDQEHFDALKIAKKENYSHIYESAATRAQLDTTAKPMMAEIYEQMLCDLHQGKTNSPIFRHHINYINGARYHRDVPYGKEEPNQIVVDYIASMTDDYFIDLHHYLFPDSTYKVEYTGYFEKKEMELHFLN